ncbi:MFS transporter [Bacillus sp. CMF21]|uniref:MDR family MFS transporter n=1 Tax=Metabacillus dongyingensis TaxID=2874282 RepID=UPI001CBC072E|nr:MFS transporter [Metabacillus dongyingensis]UAL51393.1 MFS transporter [Metabacillus dongyingensis]USK27695.1 MFS transporter [Bacillus sp. CMF21]
MPRSLWLLIIGMLINVTGSSFLWPLNTIYIHDHLGKSLTVAGVVLMFNSAASVAGNLIGGVLFDRYGGYRSILSGIILTFAAILGLVFFHGWPSYIFFLTLVGFGSGIVFPSMYALAGTVWPEGGRKAFNAIYVSQNAGVAVGAALGGLIAGYSFQYIFIANAALYAVFFLLACFGYRNIAVRPSAQTSILQQSSKVKNNDKFTALIILCSGYALCWVAYVQWQSTIAAHTQELGISLTQYSLIWTVNGALIVFAQPIVNTFVKYFAKSIKKQMMIGFVIFIVSFAAVSFADEFSGFMAAMIILTVGEMLVWPAVPTIANDLAPKGREGFYQGFVNSTATGGRMIGPLLGGVLVDLYGINMLFIVLFGLLVLAMFTTSIYDKKLKNQKLGEAILTS